MPMSILGPDLNRRDDCEAVLRSVSEWFGIEESLLMYAEDSVKMPSFALEEDGALLGFVTLLEHYPESWEVHCIAVHGSRRGSGIGTRLLEHAERWLAGKGVRFLQIKTMDTEEGDQVYGVTQKFYLAKGYSRVEVFPTIWSPKHPALQLIKRID